MTLIEQACANVAKAKGVEITINKPNEFKLKGIKKRAEISRREAEKFNRPNRCSVDTKASLEAEAEAMEEFYKDARKVD